MVLPVRSKVDDVSTARGALSEGLGDRRGGLTRTGPRELGRRIAVAVPPVPFPSTVERSAASRSLRRLAVPTLLLGADVAAFVVGLLGTPGQGLLSGLLWLALTAVLFSLAGGYRTRLTFSVLADLPGLSGRVVAASAVSSVLTAAWGEPEALRDTSVATLVVLTALLSFRALSYAAIRAMRGAGLVAHPTLIIGAGQVGTQIARVTQQHREFGLRPVGFLDSTPLLTGDQLPAPLVCGVDGLAAVIREKNVEHVIIAFTQSREADVVEIVRTADRLDCEIFFVPRLFELAALGHQAEDLLGMPLVRLRRMAYRTARWRLKRVVDVGVSALALLVTTVPMLLIGLGLRLEHGRGVIFRQERIGVDGRAFELLKFRTLRPSDEAESQTRWSITDHERLSWLGRMLRKSSLDELPQLVNILRGDMSLVGPRPERPHFVAQFEALFPHYVARHRVPCGLTGWAQINGLRGDTSIEERARFDNYYIENWSLWLDTKIVLRTFSSFMRGS